MSLVIYSPLGLSKNIHKAFKQLFKEKKSKEIWPYLGVSFKFYPESKTRVRQALLCSATTGWMKSIKSVLLQLQYNWCRQFFEKNPKKIAVTWNGLKGSRGIFMSAAKDAKSETIFLENACFPGYVAKDSQGINFGNSLVRDALFYEQWYKNSPSHLKFDKEKLKSELVSRQATYHPGVKQVTTPPESVKDKFIFCPLQVENDTQITLYSPIFRCLKTYIRTLAKVSEHLPQGWHLRIKEHPSSKVIYTDLISSLETEKFQLDNTTDTLKQVALSQSVMCINSSLGLQAFLFDKSVITLGQSFYSFGDMALNVGSLNELEETMRNIKNISFDKRLRHIFLYYLLNNYYVKLK